MSFVHDLQAKLPLFPAEGKRGRGGDRAAWF
jgi:hypothetical protein